MNAADILQREVRTVLADACFVRRDQTARALFVSDYPARHDDGKAEELRSRGFTVREEKGIWRIDLNRERAERFENDLPVLTLPAPNETNAEIVTLCRMLLLHGGFQWEDTRLTLLRLAAKEEDILYRELYGICALRLRRHECLSAGAAKLILMKMKEEEQC